MLDTNTLSHLVRAHPALAGRVVALPMAALRMSVRPVVWEGEPVRFLPIPIWASAKRPAAASE